MKINQLASIIALKEGHKSQTRISDIREILSILGDMSYETPDAIRAIVALGISRANKRKKIKKSNPN
jgi:hypothetical protein